MAKTIIVLEDQGIAAFATECAVTINGAVTYEGAEDGGFDPNSPAHRFGHALMRHLGDLCDFKGPETIVGNAPSNAATEEELGGPPKIMTLDRHGIAKAVAGAIKSMPRLINDSYPAIVGETGECEIESPSESPTEE